MKSTKLRESARGQDCTLQIPDVCQSNTETTVLCHLPDDSGTGKLAGKSDDFCACFGCYDCHTFIDNRAEFLKRYTMEDYYYFIRRAMIRTWRYWIDNQILIVRRG